MKTITTDFEYLAATTVEEALDLLSQHKDDDYKVLAGGQSLNTAMKHRLIAPEYIIDKRQRRHRQSCLISRKYSSCIFS